MQIAFAYSRLSSDCTNIELGEPQQLLFLSDGQTLKGWSDLNQQRRVPVYEIHGFWMFIAWMPLGYLLIATKRYIKGSWKLMNILHMLLGVLVSMITIWQTLEISLRFGWGLTDDPHSILGTMCIVGMLFSTVSGFLAHAYYKYSTDEAWSPKEKATKVGKVHRISSYVVLGLCNIVVFGGLLTYSLKNLRDVRYVPFGILSLLGFINIVLLSEYIHRKKASSSNLAKGEGEPEDELQSNKVSKRDLREFTAQQVDKAVELGQKLVILDNLILDSNGYERIHPGGKFTLIKNFGRDISKFFYGGYVLVNGKGSYGVHSHS